MATDPERNVAAAVADYIETLFSRQHFPAGPPNPESVTHKWGPDQVGQTSHLLARVAEVHPTHLTRPELDALGVALASLQVGVARWGGGPWRPGTEPQISARPVSTIYHLLRREAAAVDAESEASKVRVMELPTAAPRDATRRFGRWTVISKIARGGQGEAFRVVADGVSPHALKKFNFGKGDRAKQARERFIREVQALRTLNAPGFVSLVEADEREGWMVTRLYPSTLADDRRRFVGQALASLEALRPIVAALAALHEKGGVHRDVKPANVFADADGTLILGDFGIVFFRDEERLTETYERVGSRDWIAPWADVRLRMDEVKPSADVFCLGKLVWWMVSGDAVLPFWYYARPEYDLTKRFAREGTMTWINEILAVTVVEEENQCLPSAVDLLPLVDRAIAAMRKGGDVLREGEPWPCKICGLGEYRAVFEEPRVLALPEEYAAGKMSGFGALYTADYGARKMRVYACGHCGNVEMFLYSDGRRPEGWKPKSTKTPEG